MKKNQIKLLIIFILLFSNFIWSFLGIFIAIIHLPYSIHYNSDNYSITIRVKQTGILDLIPVYKNWRGIALGNIIILNLREEKGDELHESVHVEQFMRYPFIFPFLNFLETTKNGYRENRFEKEAYDRANNNYYPSK